MIQISITVTSEKINDCAVLWNYLSKIICKFWKYLLFHILLQVTLPEQFYESSHNSKLIRKEGSHINEELLRPDWKVCRSCENVCSLLSWISFSPGFTLSRLSVSSVISYILGSLSQIHDMQFYLLFQINW